MHLLAEAAGPPIDPEGAGPRPVSGLRCAANRPDRVRAHDRGGTSVAFEPFEPFESGYGPGHRVDRAIMAARNGVVPLHGLMAL
jgi:acetoin utilization protein AcuC